jgi:ABC-type transporter Mla subunit MlaD
MRTDSPKILFIFVRSELTQKARFWPICLFPSYRNGGKRALVLPEVCTGKPSREEIVTSLKTVTDAASELGKDAKESVEELGRTAGRKLDDARDQTGGALHAAASSVRKTGRQGSEAIDNFATGAADRLDATASYVEDHDLKEVFKGLRKFARQHLTGSLVFAVAIGFLAGAALNRLAHSYGKNV